ncbi:MAG: hypothetical protein Q9160_008740 [Pyrenula sp. 1 TL-2023]
MALIRCLVTGGSGFVGFYTVKAFAERYPTWHITSLDLFLPKAGLYAKTANIEAVTADITDPGSLTRAISDANPDVIVHIAGIVPPLSERYARRLQSKVYQINVEGTRNVVAAAQSAGVKALVYTSSCCSVIDDVRFHYPNIDESWPVSFSSSIYGESKALAEPIVLTANCPSFRTCVLRPSVLTGPGDATLLPSMHGCIAKGETPYILGSAFNMWDVTDVRNLAHAHVLAANNLLGIQAFTSIATQPPAPETSVETFSETSSAAGEIFFIQNNEPIYFRDLCRAVWAEFGHVPPWEVTIPTWAAWAVGTVWEYLGRLSGSAVTLNRGSIADATAMRYASGEKAKRVLGYENVIGLEQSIRESCQVGFPSPLV